MNTKTNNKLPYGHPSTLRDAPGGHQCKGFLRDKDTGKMELSEPQKKWLRRA